MQISFLYSDIWACKKDVQNDVAGKNYSFLLFWGSQKEKVSTTKHCYHFFSVSNCIRMSGNGDSNIEIGTSKSQLDRKWQWIYWKVVIKKEHCQLRWNLFLILSRYGYGTPGPC